METLETYITERLRLSSSLVNNVCLNSGDLSAQSIRASAASSNSMAFGLVELSTKATTAREDVGRLKEDLDWVRNVKFGVWIWSERKTSIRGSDRCPFLITDGSSLELGNSVVPSVKQSLYRLPLT